MASSIYIHIPFCSNICSYCDFSKLYYYPELVNKYLLALESELSSIGGGTPTSLTKDQLELLLSMVDSFGLEDKYEFTVECNIENLTEEKLIIMKNHRVNRLSIGIQSFNQKKLDFLERNYKSSEINPIIEMSKRYISNINVDLIYAVNDETLEELEKDIDMVLNLDVNHISTYSLILEENTKLFNNNVKYIDEDLDRKMYDLICRKLKSNGYNHYEISNFSKCGFESKHNMTYWKNNEYYGIGLGASGYINNIRYTNTKSINKYMDEIFRYEEEYQTDEIKLENEIILNFRTNSGINKKDFYDKFGFDLKDRYDISDLIDKNIIIETDNNYVISEDYWYLLNEILLRFIEE